MADFFIGRDSHAGIVRLLGARKYDCSNFGNPPRPAGGMGVFADLFYFSASGVLKQASNVLQILNQLHFFTKIGDFLHARCKKSLLDVKNLPVAFIVGINTIPLDPDSERGWGLAPHYVILWINYIFRPAESSNKLQTCGEGQTESQTCAFPRGMRCSHSMLKHTCGP